MEMNADLMAQHGKIKQIRFQIVNFYFESINQVCAWYELFVAGKLPNRRAYHVSFFWKDRFYIHGGQDLKEGAYGDLWRTQLVNDNEIDHIEWEEVKLTGTHPKKISHHAGVLQPAMNAFIVYGGIVGVGDASDVIYKIQNQNKSMIDLNNFNVEAFTAADQREKNGKPLPGPRDDFCLITTMTGSDETEIQPIYLFGGYRNGQKMNDIYKLHILPGYPKQYQLHALLPFKLLQQLSMGVT